ncbi:E3 ubiquitin-protein ligase UHRF1-like [Littorina saxatilis]|uniref:YDG domain-containing protein n=1 Tax=Littorina saxatilis TaxID=31220 RepID=A0AAN9BIQ8_9CAEN
MLQNLRTAAQSKDQDLTRGNLALSRSVETGNPVRVIRGYKLRSPFAPEEGYRYDGLYTVKKFWFTKGMSGFGVYKFALQRCPGQAPPPWALENDPASPSKSSDSGFSDTVKSEAGENEATSPSDEKKSDGDKDGETKADSPLPLTDNMKKDDGNDDADASSGVDSKDVSDDNEEESSIVKHDAFESNLSAVSENAESSGDGGESGVVSGDDEEKADEDCSDA